jgi:ABC-type glutathione transport system ATPase component
MVQAQILELIHRLRKELDLSFILISHDLGDGRDLRQGRRHVRRRGRRERTTADIFRNATHPYTRQLIKAFEHPREARDGELHQGRPPNLINPPRAARSSRVATWRSSCKTEHPGLTEVERPLRALRPREATGGRLSRATSSTDVRGVTMATEQTDRRTKSPETRRRPLRHQDRGLLPDPAGLLQEHGRHEKKFVKAVDHISFQIKKGEILALVGGVGAARRRPAAPCSGSRTRRAEISLQGPAGEQVLASSCATTARRRRSSSRTPTTPSIRNRRSSTSSPSRSR